MGLFDDLLGGSKKQEATPMPTTPTEVIPQGTTATPAAIDELLNISAGNVTADMPSYTAQKASQAETSPVIISETPATTEIASPVIISETPAVTPMVEMNSPIISEVAPVSPMVAETPVVTPIVSETPATTEVASPVIISETPATTETASPVIISETPAVTPMVEVNSPIMTETPVQNSPIISETPLENSIDIFGGNAHNSLFGAEIPATTEAISEEKVETPAITAEISETSLFGLENSREEKSETTSILDIEAKDEPSVENNIFAEKANVVENSMPENTEGFITAGLLQLEKMEASLAERKQKFLDQADEYRTKKEEFAKLEEEAIENSRSMDDEQKKIDTMKKYFNKQLEGPNINDSVDTALTGIAVQNAVDKTIEKKSIRKKTAIAA